MPETFTARYRVIGSKDPRFDGRFFTAVTTTGIYCRPSCPARTPKPENVVFFVTAAAAQAAGFRACRRCRPEASPGSPGWDVRADVVARALRLIAEGAMDGAGVARIARRLSVSERHLHRLMVAELGVGPLALARTRRTQTARLLLEATDLPVTDVAFAAGYASVRQFNDSIRAAFGRTPTDLRRRRRGTDDDTSGEVVVRLAHRRPYDGEALCRFLGARAVPGIEDVAGVTFRRTVRLPHAHGILSVTPHAEAGYAVARLRLDDLRDVAAAVQRCRRLFDLDADPAALGEVLGADVLLAPLVRLHPGLRVPGHVDGFELAVRAVLGQQVTVKGARTLAGRLVEKVGSPVGAPSAGLTHLFPSAQTVAGDDLSGIGLTGSRVRALRAVAHAVSEGALVLDPDADRTETRRALLALPGIGPWTADYIAMRALGDPDAFPLTDLGLRLALRDLGGPEEPRSLADRADRWRPWRGYAAMHLWTHLTEREVLATGNGGRRSTSVARASA